MNGVSLLAGRGLIGIGFVGVWSTLAAAAVAIVLAAVSVEGRISSTRAEP